MTNESGEPRHLDDAPRTGIQPGTALCLSGGGFRAMLFHAGAIRCLADLDLLPEIQAISSVSGGSITSALVAKHWGPHGLDLDAFEQEVFGFARRTIDISAVLGAWIRFRPASAHLTALYDRHLFQGRSLQDIPDAPLFVFNTTNMHSGNSFQWTKDSAHDYSLGHFSRPEVRLAEIVAASSAFPPMLSPVRIDPPGILLDADGHPKEFDEGGNRDGKLWLTDGGVYDNLGVQSVDHLETVLISDAGAPFASKAKLRSNWVSLLLRTTELLQGQVGKRRRFEELFEVHPDPRPLYWSPADDRVTPGDDVVHGGLSVSSERRAQLGATHTRLAKLPQELCHQLANLGFALTDQQVRPELRTESPPPTSFPYPGGLG